MTSSLSHQAVLSVLRGEKPVLDLSGIARSVPPIVLPAHGDGTSTQRARFYIATSPVLEALTAVTGMGLCKIGCTFRNPAQRIKNISALRYAGLWGTPENLQALPGADAWRAIPIKATGGSDAIESDLSIDSDGFASIPAPHPLNVYDVDSALTRILSRRRARPFFAGPKGRALMARAGLFETGWFYTRYLERGNLGPLRAVEDIFVIDLEREPHLLVEALAGLSRLITFRGLKPRALYQGGAAR